MTASDIFLDESGFTGSDLLNPDQPQFCVASAIIGNDRAREILSQSFPRYGGNEYKFGTIWRRATNRSGLAKLGQLLAPIAEEVFVYRIDKRFCVLTKLVDSLIEPILHAQGFNFYANGYAPRYCNMWYYGIQMFAEPALFEATINQYQSFARNPTLETLKKLQIWLRITAESVPNEIRHFYSAAALGADHFLDFHNLDVHRGSSEIQFTTVLQTICHWRARLKDDFAVWHDASSNFFRSSKMWEKITNSEVPSQTHVAADGSMNEFPLRVVQTEAVESSTSAAIQLCDIIAGLSAKICREREEDRETLHAIIDAGFGEVSIDGIRPEPELPNGPPQQLTGPDVVDLLTKIMFAP